MKQSLLLALLVMTVAALAPTSLAHADPTKASSTAAAIKMKIPHDLRGFTATPAAVQNELSRDFRSRYPVAAPTNSDVLDAWVEQYSATKIRDPYGALDTRHYFRVIARHADGLYVYLDIYVYERATFEADQDPIFIETFQVVGWQR